MHIHLGSIIIHALIYGIVYRLLRHLSTPELLVLGAVVVVAVIFINRASSSRRGW